MVLLVPLVATCFLGRACEGLVFLVLLRIFFDFWLYFFIIFSRVQANPSFGFKKYGLFVFLVQASLLLVSCVCWRGICWRHILIVLEWFFVHVFFILLLCLFLGMLLGWKGAASYLRRE